MSKKVRRNVKGGIKKYAKNMMTSGQHNNGGITKVSKVLNTQSYTKSKT